MRLDCFEGPLAVFGHALVKGDDHRPVTPVPHLLQAQCLDQLLLRVYGPDLMPSQLPVLVSQWSKYYFMQLIPPVMVAGLVEDWYWPLELDQVAL